MQTPLEVSANHWRARPAAPMRMALAAVLTLAGGASAQPTFTRIPGLPGLQETWAADVSGDGRVVVGTLHEQTQECWYAFRWTQDGGMQNLGALPGHTFAHALGVSADGQTVVGTSRSNEPGTRAFRWTPGAGMQDIGAGRAIATSADGRATLVVEGASGWATLWSVDSDPAVIGLPPGALSGTAIAMTPDARTLVGAAFYPDTVSRTVRWSPDSGFEVLPLPMGFIRMVPADVSPDGQVITGHLTRSGVHDVMFRWTPLGGAEELPRPEGGTHTEGVSTGPGGAILGGSALMGTGYHAIIWSRGLGSVSLESHLRLLGLGFTMNLWDLAEASVISDDGSTIAGFGRYRETPFVAWVLRLNACPADFNADLEFSSQDFFAFLTAFFALDPSADFNADGEIGSADFFEFLSAYFQGC